jgi:hypothetical protein
MKTRFILLILMLLGANCVSAQFVVTPNGLRSAVDTATNAVVIRYPKVAKKDLYKTFREYAESYSEKRQGLSFFDNEQNGFMIKFVGVGRFGTGTVKTGHASFSLLFIFEDEAVTIQAQSLKLSRIALFQGGAKQYIYTKKGKLSRQGKILKPMVEREVNTHVYDIADTASTLLAIMGE